jgi:hypothetical protein
MNGEANYTGYYMYKRPIAKYRIKFNALVAVIGEGYFCVF